jgi:hypothetical protein
MLKFEIPAPQFFSVVNRRFQNKELSKMTQAGAQKKLTTHSLLSNKNKTAENSNFSTSKV